MMLLRSKINIPSCNCLLVTSNTPEIQINKFQSPIVSEYACGTCIKTQGTEVTDSLICFL
jgi:hypothetical protein